MQFSKTITICRCDICLKETDNVTEKLTCSNTPVGTELFLNSFRTGRRVEICDKCKSVIESHLNIAIINCREENDENLID